MHRSNRYVLLFVLALCPPPAHAQQPDAKGRAIEAGRATFSIVDHEDGLHWWRRTNQEFRIETVQLEPSGDLLKYLFLTERVVETHIGIEGSESRLKVTAYALTEENVGPALWTFETEGDDWELDGRQIAVANHGCCDAQGTARYFRVKDGKRVE